MGKLYQYKIVREDPQGGQGKRIKTYYSYTSKLKVGGLYVHLGKGFPGLQRVLSVTVEEPPD